MPQEEPEPLAVPPLRSGGVMLGYQCNLRCRHCNYRCRPGAGEWMSEATLDAVLDALGGERRLIDIHISGGEATLNPELLLKAVRRAVERNIRLSYLETNGWFGESVEKAVEVFKPLREAGLNAVLISVSPYHNEGLPLRRTMNSLEAGVKVFGHDGVFPWLTHFLPMQSEMDPETPHDLDEFLDANNIPDDDGTLLELFPLTPGGRVPEGLRRHFTPLPAEAFREGHCLEMLTDVSHFHFDPDGNLFTGHCPGIVSGRIGDLHGEKSLESHPVFAALAWGGPFALMQIAQAKCGFEPDPAGYISPCDLCFQVRRRLFLSAPGEWPELGPAIFYTE